MFSKMRCCASSECKQWAALPLRLGLGLIFIYHGAQKLFGWYGGPGLDGVTGFFGNLGFAPASVWAWLVALVEFFGGVIIVTGKQIGRAHV